MLRTYAPQLLKSSKINYANPAKANINVIISGNQTDFAKHTIMQILQMRTLGQLCLAICQALQDSVLQIMQMHMLIQLCFTINPILQNYTLKIPPMSK
jgi:hypothetical protein